MAENFYGVTDPGKVRDNNEDTFLAKKVSNGLVLAAVIDGVGGYNGGEVAAAIARDVVAAQLANINGDIIQAMIDTFKLANKNIVDKKAEDRELESMACVATMAMVDVPNNQFYYAHVGDTRLYLLRDGSLVKISKDHSFVGFLEDSGRITETAAMNHPKRNEINKALGFTTQIDTDESFIETGQSPFLPGDMLLLCSDGLTDMVDKNQILSIITGEGTLKDKATTLIDAANANGGRDNVTAVLVKNDKDPAKPIAAVPATAETRKKPQEDNVMATAPRESKSQSKEEETTPMAQNKTNGLTIILGILCLVFLATSVWLYMSSHKGTATPQTADTTAQKLRNQQEVKLQDAIDEMKGDTLVLSDTVFKQPILLTDTLHIDQDSLYVKVKGNITLKRDTTYHGPALAIGSASKHIVLDNLKFEDFDVAIHVTNSALGLVNTQFENCKISIQKNVSFYQKKSVNYYFEETNILKDSIAKPTKKANGTR
ncbi:serine/threonine-protein phosphatase [Inquilinus sp. KBS0705]|nr:serine/threonine-protein phosphatase [Inquilinus sp. KBS0705]